MCPSQLFLVSLLILLLLFVINSSRADNNTASAYCPSSVCNGVNISYPFWRLDSYNSVSPLYCGYPGFGINCSGTNSVLHISEDSFEVEEINYSSHSLTLVDIDVADSRGCPRAAHNLTLDEDSPLEYSELDMYINFYYNCTASLPDSAYRLDCLASSGKTSFYSEKNDLNWYGICEKKLVVAVTAGGWGKGLGAVMSEGFVLDWHIAKECTKCEASQGCCGYNNSTRQSLCFCKDGTIRFDKCKGIVNVSTTPCFNWPISRNQYK